MGLKKSLGLWDVFCIASGAMISSGLFVLPGIAYNITGPSLILAYVAAGFLNIPAMFAQAELSTAMPKSGGSYFCIDRCLGVFAGSIAGFISWLCIALKAAFACVGLGTLYLLIYPEGGEWGLKITALIACFGFTILNLVSVKGTGRLQSVLVSLLFIILIAYCFIGFNHIQPQNYTPFFTHSWQNFFMATGMVFISYGGLTKVVDVAEEIKLPQRNLPLGMFLSFVLVNILYAMVMIVTVGVLQGEELASTLAPISLGAGSLWGNIGISVISIAAFMAYATTANAGILSASRSPLAMSRDGLLPTCLAHTSLKYNTPHTAIIATFVFMAFTIVFLSVENLAKTASTMFLLSFILANASVICIRRAKIQGYRPSFKVPLYPYLPILGIIIYSFLIADMGFVPLITTAIFFVLVGAWHIFYVQSRIQREAAFAYTVRHLLSKRIRRTHLEDELLQISLERDGIIPDRFDEALKKAKFLDIKEKLSPLAFFEKIAEEAEIISRTKKEKIKELMLEREQEESPEVNAGIAVYDLLVKGHSVFEIIIARCNDGIVFSEFHKPITTFFVIIGSENERNFRMKSLMAIAHIVSEDEFVKRWYEARDEEQLRDILLLSRRVRMKKVKR